MKLQEALGIIDRQREEIEELQAENLRLRAALKEALERIEQLERAAARQAAPFRRRESKKVDPAEKKTPGRPQGHRGTSRSEPDQVDEEVEVALEACPHCGGPVEDRVPLVQFIEEIPPVRPKVTRLVTWTGICGRCGDVRSTHPEQVSIAEGAARVHLGPRALGLAATLNKQCGLTMRNTCRVLKKLCGLSLSPGGLTQALGRMARKVEPLYENLVGRLRSSRAVFADETSWWVGGPGWWLWTFTNPQTTVYRVEESRGSQVVREILGEQFKGMLVSDCLSSYDPPDYRKHKCIAHHLRAIAQARDRPDTENTHYLRQWKLFFSAVIVLSRLRANLDEPDFVDKRAHLEAWCDQLLAEPVEQTGDAAVRNRLAKQRDHLLGCLYEAAAEPTNNRAERALRPAVIARKLSCGNKTTSGKRTWEILTSLGATCQQTSQDFADYLASHLPLAAPAG